MKILDLEQGSEDWKEYRRNCITASDFAVYMAHLGKCESLYGTSLVTNLHNKITGKELADNPYFVLGRDREITVRDEYNFKNLSNLQPLVCCLDENERIMASLDGYEYPSIIEMKSTSKERDKWSEIINYTQWQIVHQIHISDALSAKLLITDDHGTCEFHVKPSINRDEWLEHCNDYLKLLDNAKVNDGNIEIAMYVDIKKRIKVLENQLKPIEEKLKTDNPDGLITTSLTISKQIKNTKDWDRFLADNKLTFSDKYLKPTSSLVIRIKDK